MLRGEIFLFNMLYFLCKSDKKSPESGKNVFDFMEKCIYNGTCGRIFASFLEELEVEDIV